MLLYKHEIKLLAVNKFISVYSILCLNKYNPVSDFFEPSIHNLLLIFMGVKFIFWLTYTHPINDVDINRKKRCRRLDNHMVCNFTLKANDTVMPCVWAFS